MYSVAEADITVYPVPRKPNIELTFLKPSGELEPFTDSEKMQLQEHHEALSDLLEKCRLDGKVYDADYISVIAGLRSIIAQTKPLNPEEKEFVTRSVKGNLMEMIQSGLLSTSFI